MWEIPLYLIVLPLLTISFSLLCAIKYRRYFVAPSILFISFNIPTIIMPFITNVGWAGIFGWAVFYTVVSLLISLVIWSVRKTQYSPNVA
ncbi:MULTISPECIES: hypothetical protein [Bacillus]|uniref:hypothetical protein n=1 Tax=Bacillus TaxID=1386 RepID=UPI000BB71A50|nr:MULTISPECIES: hypothetical protein [Bacillus]